ncbi:hypothetical protein K443DRAFT_687149 [Laccaria amethystina LaAM-08-1]|uniref:Uncharacterized protein n=1 Tax=Laccaria amethystina LaAM-08-1 TaxID=1095629 RepID=A0A0C9WQ45_9AGAR|nr:hypothetical protein K443DRAFT_687149 [Laccaria amethystina LaAM-08-1]
MTLYASNIDAKDGWHARTYPHPSGVSCFVPILSLSVVGAASSPTAGPNDYNPASIARSN